MHNTILQRVISKCKNDKEKVPAPLSRRPVPAPNSQPLCMFINFTIFEKTDFSCFADCFDDCFTDCKYAICLFQDFQQFYDLKRFPEFLLVSPINFTSGSFSPSLFSVVWYKMLLKFI